MSIKKNLTLQFLHCPMLFQWSGSLYGGMCHCVRWSTSNPLWNKMEYRNVFKNLTKEQNQSTAICNDYLLTHVSQMFTMSMHSCWHARQRNCFLGSFKNILTIVPPSHSFLNSFDEVLDVCNVNAKKKYRKK